ncbi:hypothetical protein HUT06_34030 [Actinomadura sp. NAK00032]|uniref:hypothetical protein n=1 Tax=Actinomadura sp. NAK00032 TaxID=2742128 RepID=UPI001591AE24|nr:hypothetical protein [Actinomadura sp. NAK00032]QKW38416.1 hypothetical protein HUT06_34030 [Actinomadura sp. NAK00032]
MEMTMETPRPRKTDLAAEVEQATVMAELMRGEAPVSGAPLEEERCVPLIILP